MTVDQVELKEIPSDVVASSLEWEDFKTAHLAEVDPHFLGNIEFAFAIAKEAHSKLKPRDTGEPNFSHPIMAATYLIQAGCSHPHHIMAGLLHDVPEDNLEYLLKAQERVVQGYTSIAARSHYLSEIREEDIIMRHFEFETMEIVDAVTKPEMSARTLRAKYRAERVYQKQLEGGPTGAWVVKAADRLHNVRTMPPENPDRARRKVTETREGYMPIFWKGAQIFPEGKVLYYQLERDLRKLEVRLR